MLHFDEKNGKSREIPVRHDLEQIIFEYLDAAGLRTARKDTPLFRTAYKKTGRFTKNTVRVIDICRMVKRRLKDAGLPVRLSPHSFRVTTATLLLDAGVDIIKVKELLGHRHVTTTQIYDKRRRSTAESASHVLAI